MLTDLIQAAEAFDNMNDYDTLSVEWNDETGGVAEMHRPDGIPDIVQQVAHGGKQMLAQYQVLGGIGGTMEVRTLRQYTHLGDPATDTDGYIYDPSLDENEIVERDGKAYSGKPDDRFLLLSGFSSNLLGNNSANFAGAAYLLRDYYPEMAQEFLDAALAIWDRERGTNDVQNGDWNTLVQLMLATDKFEMTDRYDFFKERVTGLVNSIVTSGNMSNRYNSMFIMHLMDQAYRDRVQAAVEAYAATVNYNTPYGVQWTTGSGWGGSRRYGRSAGHY